MENNKWKATTSHRRISNQDAVCFDHSHTGMIPDMLAVHTYMAFANYWIACILPLWRLDPTKPAGGECLAYRACQLSVVFLGNYNGL